MTNIRNVFTTLVLVAYAWIVTAVLCKCRILINFNDFLISENHIHFYEF